MRERERVCVRVERGAGQRARALRSESGRRPREPGAPVQQLAARGWRSMRREVELGRFDERSLDGWCSQAGGAGAGATVPETEAALAGDECDAVE